MTAMSAITAYLVGSWWVVLFGVIGYQVVLLVELTWGGAMGRTGRVRLARAEQENRELRDEKARLSGTIDELMKKGGADAQAASPARTLERSGPLPAGRRKATND
jgi:hypothetical protein